MHSIRCIVESAFVHLHNVHRLCNLRKQAQKAVVECVAVLRSWEVRGSNFDPETSYPARGFSQLSSFTQIRPQPLPFTSFTIDYYLTMLPFDRS
jgi:hypothetical protein